MRYVIHFINNSWLEISKADYEALCEEIRSGGITDTRFFFITDRGDIISLDQFNYLNVESPGTGAIVTPPTPEQVQKERDATFAKTAMNPDNIISRARGED